MLHRIQGSLAVIQIRSIGHGDQGCLFIKSIGFFSFQMFQRHVGYKSGDYNEAKKAENEISQYEF